MFYFTCTCNYGIRPQQNKWEGDKGGNNGDKTQFPCNDAIRMSLSGSMSPYLHALSTNSRPADSVC